MKKQFIAKLLVLVMVLTMVPGTMLVSKAAASNNQYYYVPADTSVSTSSASSVDAKDITTADGEATIKVTVKNGVSAVTLTAKAVEGLADVAADGAITLVLEDDGAEKLNLSFPAKEMKKLAEDTSADLTIKSSVATITIPNNVLASALGNAGTVKVSAQHTAKAVGFTVQVRGKSLKSAKGIVVEF